MILEGAARNVFHGDVVRPVLRATLIVNGDYIGMVETGGTPRLASEEPNELLVPSVLLLEHLERHVPIEDLVVGKVNFGHASAAQGPTADVAVVDKGLWHKYLIPTLPLINAWQQRLYQMRLSFVTW